MKFQWLAGACVVSLLAGMGMAADLIVLRDGSELRGEFLGADSRAIRFLNRNDEVERIAIDRVDRIVFSSDSGLSSAPARGSSASRSASPPPQARRTLTEGPVDTVPVGTVLVVRMIDPISSDKDHPGDVFQGTLEKPILQEGVTLAPKGASVQVQLVHVEQSGKLRGEEEIALILRRITVDGRNYIPDTTFAEVSSEGKGGQTAKVVAGTTAVGAVIGAIAGGKKGAAIGAGTGAGAGVAVQMARGKEVKVPSEALLSFILKEPLRLN